MWKNGWIMMQIKQLEIGRVFRIQNSHCLHHDRRCIYLKMEPFVLMQQSAVKLESELAKSWEKIESWLLKVVFVFFFFFIDVFWRKAKMWPIQRWPLYSVMAFWRCKAWALAVGFLWTYISIRRKRHSVWTRKRVAQTRRMMDFIKIRGILY